MEPQKPPIVGIMGGSQESGEAYEAAYRLGRLLAERGYIVLTGGGSGVMEAASKGAYEAGGMTLGILPGRDATESPPNSYVRIPVFTGISHARNLANVLTSRVVVAVGGGLGTLSEIALALRSGKPVVLLRSWRFSIEGKPDPEGLYRVADAEEAAETVARLLGDRSPEI